VPGLTYVGRLDFLTEGVLLLTTDGEAAHRLTHPATEVERVYVATVTGNVKEAAEQARRGVELEDGVAKPDWVEVHPLAHRRWGFEIALREGRTREVRRICEVLGLEVERLVRTRFGPVLLGGLAPGQARDLSARERALVEALAHGRAMPRSRPTPRGKARPKTRSRPGAILEGRGEPPGRSARPRPAARSGEAPPARESRTGGPARPASASKPSPGRKPARGGAARSRVLGEQGRGASTRRPPDARPKARGPGRTRSS
jgi:pseudouridine synthase